MQWKQLSIQLCACMHVCNFHVHSGWGLIVTVLHILTLSQLMMYRMAVPMSALTRSLHAEFQLTCVTLSILLKESPLTLKVRSPKIIFYTLLSTSCIIPLKGYSECVHAIVFSTSVILYSLLPARLHSSATWLFNGIEAEAPSHTKQRGKSGF